jgi:hypothetical protein
VQVFNSLFSKIVWGIICLLLFGAGCVFVLRNFLNPPPVPIVPASNTAPQAQPTPTNPTQTETSSPTPSDSATATPTPTQPSASDTSTPPQSSDGQAPETSATPTPAPSTPSSTTPSLVTSSPTATPNKYLPTSEPNNSNSSALPALALPNQVVLSVPKKLKPGAMLSIFENVDNNNRPDPINYSPTTTKEVAGLSLTSVKQSEFQEVSGYFLAERSGNFAFVITIPDNSNLDSTNLRLKIDGQPLSNVKGGSVTLDKGWHKVDLFYFESNSSTVNQIQVKWGLEGSNLKRLQTWREVS